MTPEGPVSPLSSFSSEPEGTPHFTPTLILHIPFYNAFKKQKYIYDLTALVPTHFQYPSDAFNRTAHTIGKALAASPTTAAPPPYLTITKPSAFSSHHTIHLPGPLNAADSNSTTSPTAANITFDASVWGTGDPHIKFPPDSPHSSHPITLKPYTNVLNINKMCWVQESVKYVWAVDGAKGFRRMTLYKQLGERGEGKKLGRVVGRYREPINLQGGTMVVDQGEVDGVVAVLMLLGMLRKHR